LSTDDLDRANEDPAELLSSLGVEQGDAPPVDMEAFASVRDRINADLHARQGPWRDMGWSARAWPIGAAALVGVAFLFALKPAALEPAGVISCVLAGVTAGLALFSLLLSPAGPALGEKLALSALVSGAAALGVQVYSGLGGGMALADALPGSFRCGGMLTAGAVVPLLLLVWALKRSGLPMRVLHAGALAAAAFSLAGMGIFRHCAGFQTWHTVVAHLVIPVVGATVVAALMYRLMQRQMPD
jgi:hypothetical protein